MKPILQGTVTVNDLAELLCVQKATIYRWIADGKLPPALRIGKGYRWREADIAAFLERDGQEQP